MSTPSIATTQVGGYAGSSADKIAASATTSTFKRFIRALMSAREVEAKRLVHRYISQMSEAERKDLGYPAAGDFKD